MDQSHWARINGGDRAQFREARLAAHYAAQWLARIARAYVPPLPHDLHTNLGWDNSFCALATRALPGGGGAALNIPELALVLGGEPGGGFPLDGRTDADVRQWLGDRLRAMSLDAGGLDAPSPYQLPDHPIGRGAPYGAAALAGPLTELAVWFGNADLVLGEATESVRARGLEAPPVRCWPHHFDLDSLIPLGQGRTVGIGWCPGDDYYDEPYFYVSPYPAPDVAKLPALPLGGHWHTHHFTAAIALATNVAAAKNQRAETEAFLRAAVEFLVAT